MQEILINVDLFIGFVTGGIGSVIATAGYYRHQIKVADELRVLRKQLYAPAAHIRSASIPAIRRTDYPWTAPVGRREIMTPEEQEAYENE